MTKLHGLKDQVFQTIPLRKGRRRHFRTFTSLAEGEAKPAESPSYSCKRGGESNLFEVQNPTIGSLLSDARIKALRPKGRSFPARFFFYIVPFDPALKGGDYGVLSGQRESFLRPKDFLHQSFHTGEVQWFC
jgi:hypothetical protein